MNILAILLLLVTGSGILLAPPKLAIASFLVGCLYMTAGQGIDLGGLNLPIFRILLLFGICRVVLNGDALVGGVNKIDKFLFVWLAWVMFASLFHEWMPGSGPKWAAGALFNVTAFYLMIRSFCRDTESLEDLFGILCWVLVPVAILMVIEQFSHRNLFSVFGGVPEIPEFRNGRYRAQGPFSHAILAGTVGAGCIPLVIATWNKNPLRAIVGLGSCLSMVVTSASSGPIMSMIFGLGAMALWWKKELVRVGLLAAIPVYIALAFVMERPPYYIISKIDLTGGSSSWHRSFLIEQTIKHFDEWWLFGTDRTIHWMPNQGHISDIHTDITNQYISYGVSGGLLSMALVITLIWLAFRTVGRLAENPNFSSEEQFMFWCVGSSLFAYAASAISVAFFGQALFFFWLPIAAMGSFYWSSLEEDEVLDDDPLPGNEGEDRSSACREMVFPRLP